MSEEYGTFYYGEETYGVDTFTISNVEHTYLGLRIYFSNPCTVDSALINPDNYQITVSLPDVAYDFGVISVTPEDVENPEYVDLEVTDCTGDEDYTLEIVADVIKDIYDNYITTGNNTFAFTGVTEAPEVLYVIPLSLTTMRVTFSKYMAQNQDLYNPSNYVWTSGLNTLQVAEDTNSSVILTTTEQTPSEIYELTVG